MGYQRQGSEGERELIRPEWEQIVNRVGRLWPEAKPWPAETVDEYFDRLKHLPTSVVEDAVCALGDTERVRPPRCGDILGWAKNERSSSFSSSAKCQCPNSIVAYETCQAGHPDGWIDRRKLDARAHKILADAKVMGIEVNPNDHLDLREQIISQQLRAFYAKNQREGRAIDDPGDEDGNPQRRAWSPPQNRQRGPLHSPGATETRITAQGTGSTVQAATAPVSDIGPDEIAEAYLASPESWPREKIVALDADTRAKVRAIISARSNQEGETP